MIRERHFWETCDPVVAHVEITRHLSSEKKLVSQWERQFISLLDWEGLTVLDYGIGNGLLGQVLLGEKGASKYIGVDIAERSREAAKRKLSGKPADIISDEQFYESEIQTDVFVSQACVQYFPTLRYLDAFLDKVLATQAKAIFLQIAYSPQTRVTRGISAPLTIDTVNRSCLTNVEYVLKRLPGYRCADRMAGTAGDYIFLALTRNENGLSAFDQ